MAEIPMRYRVDLDKTINTTPLNTLFAMGDAQAHRFELTITHGSVAEDLTGCTVKGKFVSFSNNMTVNLTGSVTGGNAVVTLTQACYAQLGRFALVIQIAKGSVKTSVFYGDGYMRSTTTDNAIDGNYIVYDTNVLLSKIQEIENAISSANAATQSANAATKSANAATQSANAAIQSANAATQSANAATKSANAATSTANQAAEKLEKLGATAKTNPPGSDATVDMSDDGTRKIVNFGIPRGDKGSPGAVVSDTQPDDPDVGVWIKPYGGATYGLVSTGASQPTDPEVSVWINPEDSADDTGAGVALDPTLTASDKAAPADAVGAIRQVADMAEDALARGTLSGTCLVIGDAIAGRVMRCTCDSPVTVRSRNRVALGDISFTGQFKLVKLAELIPAGTYRFSARTESTDTDADVSLIAIGGSYVRIAHDGQRHSATVTIKSDCQSMYLYSSTGAAAGTGDTAYWRDIMITDGTADYPYEPGIETVTYENPSDVVLNEITNIVEADTDISITYAKRNEWLNSILSATKSAELNAQTLGYVTPEMFGAVGDGVTDDLAAVQAAFASAQELGLPVMGNRSYLVSGSIAVGSGMDVQMNSVICTASEAAVQIKGSNIHASIRSIKANGVGMELMGDGIGITYNEIALGSVKSGGDCIVLHSVNAAIFANRVQFRQLAAGGDVCCCIRIVFEDGGKFITENIFSGGLCTNADWAYLGVAGNNKFYDFQVENSIKGGFCLTGGPCTIIGARYAESQRDGEYPYLKISVPGEVENSNAGTIAAVRFIGADILKINEIDVSEVTTDVYQDNYPDNKSKLASTGSLGHIDCRINGYGVTGENGYTIYQTFAEGALIWGNCLIFQGVPRKRYRVTESLDLRTIGENTPGLPTIFDIGCAGCEIRLHPTYCFMGLDRFRVIQTAEYTATIYDYYAGIVVFDGAALGEGEFEVETYLDPDYTRAYIDGEGMAWRVRRLDGTGSTGSGGTPETPAEEAQLSVDDSGNAAITGATLAVDESGNATISGATLTVDSSGNATIA